MKKILLILLVLCLANRCFGATRYVRPAGGSYGSENGSDYDNAWDGLVNVIWDADESNVGPGDTLYVCGFHIYDMVNISGGIVTKANINIISGTSGSRIIVRGDYPEDPGIIWGAYLPTYLTWVDETGCYSLDSYYSHAYDWFFEDVTVDSWVILDKKSSIQEVKDNAGSFYWYVAEDILYVRCTDSGDPTGRIFMNNFGYEFIIANNAYITFLNLTFHHFLRISGPHPGTNPNHIRWEGCTFDYGPGIYGLLAFYDDMHYMEVIDCDLSWAANGIYTYSQTDTDGPSNYIFSGNNIHDIGVRGSTQNSDAHAIGIQGGHDGLIEDNICDNVGSGVTLYAFTNQVMKDNIVRRNIVRNTHTLGGANSRGIETGCDSDASADKSGNEFYQNIVMNVGVGMRLQFEQEQKVYNNIFYNCSSGLMSTRNYNDTGANIKLRNNIFLDNTFHIRWYSNASTYTVDSNYNLFYPISGDVFFHNTEGDERTYEEWRNISVGGSIFDPDSLADDPDFLSAGGGNFKLQSDSPAIDAGVDVGLTEDYIGTSIPQGEGFDIGIYEYINGGNGIRYLLADLFLRRFKND